MKFKPRRFNRHLWIINKSFLRPVGNNDSFIQLYFYVCIYLFIFYLADYSPPSTQIMVDYNILKYK